MKIIIAGAGEVGYQLSKQLSLEEHDIIVIDTNSSALERLNPNTDVLTIVGSSLSFNTLKQANIKSTDLIVAVTSNEAINLSTCSIAKQMGVGTTIARVSNDEYTIKENLNKLQNIGVDYVVNPEELASIEIVKLMKRIKASDTLEFEDGKIILLIRLELFTVILIFSPEFWKR